MGLDLHTIFPATSQHLTTVLNCTLPQELPEKIAKTPQLLAQFPFLAELAAIELLAHTVKTAQIELPENVAKLTVHPGLEIVPVQWSGLPQYIGNKASVPVQGEAFIIVVPAIDSQDVRIFEAGPNELLALKIVVENLDIQEVAAAGGVSTGNIDSILQRAVSLGLLLAPPSRLIRDRSLTEHCAEPQNLPHIAEIFTLQWHITQRCDLHCRHCYDRSSRSEITLQEGIHVLDQLYSFTKEHNVTAQVTFTGGNPFMAPQFINLYREAAERGFYTAILGNPVRREELEKVNRIRKPEFYQVSLEGLQAHNDYIRGEGHFQRTLGFLEVLKEAEIFSMVMLTLTKANMGEVLPLAKMLEGKVDLFTFNRLASIGEGASLASVHPEEYQKFLENYLAEAEKYPHLSLKDNFFNVLLFQQGRKLTGGCTGFGCGAAFNFLSLLPDGQVHACRKMNSPVGNLRTESLTAIYHSEIARKYRNGCSGCAKCSIRPVCGGCLAVAQGFGQDIFTEIDPYCFMNTPSR